MSRSSLYTSTASDGTAGTMNRCRSRETGVSALSWNTAFAQCKSLCASGASAAITHSKHRSVVQSVITDTMSAGPESSRACSRAVCLSIAGWKLSTWVASSARVNARLRMCSSPDEKAAGHAPPA